MAKLGTAKAAERINNEAKQKARRTITFYLLRGPTVFQNRGPERNSCAGRALAPQPRLMQLKIKCHGGDHFHWPAAVRERPHPPLLHRADRRIRQRRRTLHDFVHLYPSI